MSLHDRGSGVATALLLLAASCGGDNAGPSDASLPVDAAIEAAPIDAAALDAAAIDAAPDVLEAGSDAASDGGLEAEAAPSLYGSTVTFVVDAPTLSNPISHQESATVGPGVEFPDIVNDALPGYYLFHATVDVGPSSVDITYPNMSDAGVPPAATFNGCVFTFAGAPMITGVQLDQSSTYSASQVGLSFTVDTVTVNLAGAQTVASTSRVLVDIQF